VLSLVPRTCSDDIGGPLAGIPTLAYIALPFCTFSTFSCNFGTSGSAFDSVRVTYYVLVLISGRLNFLTFQGQQQHGIF
jgi:hypothetical protein